MKIDWFTVAAQVVNFLILVWLLKRFLYKPILAAIDAREKRVADNLADAAARQAEAKAEREEFRRRNADFEQRRDGLLGEAKQQAEDERGRLLEQARDDAEALRERLREEAEREKAGMGQEIARRTRQEVFALARKTLADLAGATLEERMAEVFEQRLRELDGPARKALGGGGDLRVRSAFELPPARRDSLLEALAGLLPQHGEVVFETAPELVNGVELVASGHKVCWSVADHLASVERTVEELLEEAR